MWPRSFLVTVPNPTEAGTLAASVRRLVLGTRDVSAPILDLAPFLAAAGVAAEVRDLGASAGGCEAVVAPHDHDGFVVLVDPTPASGWAEGSEATRTALKRRRVRFRIAHELAHTLFYARTPGGRPRRFQGRSAAEELFCDRFAASLLLPDAATSSCMSAKELVALHRRYDVSLEVAVRAWTDVHERATALLYWRETRANARLQWKSPGWSPRKTGELLRLPLLMADRRRQGRYLGDTAVCAQQRQVVVLATQRP